MGKWKSQSWGQDIDPKQGRALGKAWGYCGLREKYFYRLISFILFCRSYIDVKSLFEYYVSSTIGKPVKKEIQWHTLRSYKSSIQPDIKYLSILI